jgi:DNA-binding NarL/FixJ family response regulator
MACNVLIVEDDPHLRAAFADAVRGAPDLCLVGLATDLADGMRLLEENVPDVMLVDLGLPSGSGIDLIRKAATCAPQCDSMVITMFADDRLVIECIEAGATGYLLKDARDIELVENIRLLNGGGSPISPAIARRLLMRFAVRPDAKTGTATATIALSTRERAVLSMSAKGYNYEEIARLMELSRSTVETYVKRLYRKLQVHGKTEAIYEARQLGLLDD